MPRVGTPSRRGDGHADLSYVFAAAEEIADLMDGYTVVVTKSTVPVGTNRKLSELGATSDNIAALTQDALRDLIILNTPRYPTRGEIHELYAKAL